MIEHLEWTIVTCDPFFRLNIHQSNCWALFQHHYHESTTLPLTILLTLVGYCVFHGLCSCWFWIIIVVIVIFPVTMIFLPIKTCVCVHVVKQSRRPNERKANFNHEASNLDQQCWNTRISLFHKILLNSQKCENKNIFSHFF